MNILKEKVDVTNESKMRFHQLQIAHNSTIMVYAKVDIQGHGLVKEMARKLRPEFGRFFLATEVRECIKLIEKHNCDESIPGIDLLIMDADHNSIKFLDMINKRPQTKATASLPLISTIMVLPEAATGGNLQTGLTPKDAQSQILEVGGASHICDHKTTIQEVFYCTLESLSHRKTVESAFRDLKAAKIKAAKYPFLPIFGKKISVGEEEDSDTDDDFAGFEDESEEGIGNFARSSNSMDGSGTSLKELDDWTDSSSMLPEFVRSSRNKVIQGIKSRHSSSHLQLPSKVESRDGKGGKESMSIQDRQAADKNIVKFLNTGEPLEKIPQADGSVHGTPRRRADSSAPPSPSSSASQAGSPKQTPKRPAAAAAAAAAGAAAEKKNQAGEAEEKEGGGAPVNKNRAAAEAAAMANTQRGRGARAKMAAPSPLMTKPTAAVEGEGDEGEGGQADLDEELSVQVSALEEPEEDEQGDDMTVQSPSVGGSDNYQAGGGSVGSPYSRERGKRGAIMYKGGEQDANLLEYLLDSSQRPTFRKANTFKISKKLVASAKKGSGGGAGGDDGASVASEDGAGAGAGAGGAGGGGEGRGEDSRNTLEPFISKDVPDMSIHHSVGGLDKHYAIEQWRIIGASHYDVDQMKGGHIMDDTHHHNEDGGGGGGGAGEEKEGQGGSSGGGKRSSVFLSDKKETNSNNINSSNNKPKVGMSGSEKRRAATDPAITAAATRTLKRMARDTAPDVQLNHLIKLELSHGKVTVGDRDLLEAGQKAEAEGLHDVAIAMYKRAGLHTNKPHLSQLFLARTHYYLGKFMMALEHLNNAVDFQNKIRHLAIFSADDHFIAHFNRAMVHFRLGDDEKGIVDLEEAIQLNPDDMRAKGVYPVALRRMGRYGESIESSKANALMKKEHERRAKEEELIKREKLMLRRMQARRRQAVESGSLAGGGGGGSLDGGLSKQASIMSSGSGARGAGARIRGGVHAGPSGSLEGGPSSHEDATTIAGTQVLPIHCFLEDRGGGTFSSRKEQRERELMQEGSTSGQVGEALRVFKLTNGFRDNLFEELFTEPSELQKSLVVAPAARTAADIDTISTSLRLFDFLRPLDSSAMSELARKVEYRAVHNRNEQNVFSQNTAADGVVLLLRGGLQGRLETNDPVAGKLVVDDVEPYQATGYIDALFVDPLNPIIRDLYVDIKESRDGRASAVDLLALDGDTSQAKAKGGRHDANSSSIAGAAGATTGGGGGGREGDAGVWGGLPPKSTLRSDNGRYGGKKNPNLNLPPRLLAHYPSLLEHPALPWQGGGPEDPEALPDKLPRPLQPGMFISYSFAHRLTEMLIVNRDTFQKLLYPLAAAEFKKRVESVEGCAVFKGWQKEDLVRLARMGRVRIYHSGDLILKQGTKPDYLSLIMKGMCKSYKAPNKSTVLSAKLASAKEKAEKHDLKYCYDSRLRNTLTKGQLDIHPKTSERRRRSLIAKSHVTVSEAIRYSLGVEIKLLEKELSKAIEAEEAHALEELSMDEAKESVTSKLSEVSTLQWPQLFGESCVIDPGQGTSHGTIVADTTLEVLCIHKSQLQTFRIKEDVLEHIKYRSVCYPEDEELLAQKERQEAWELQRVGIVKNLSTPKEEYLEPFYV